MKQTKFNRVYIVKARLNVVENSLMKKKMAAANINSTSEFLRQLIIYGNVYKFDNFKISKSLDGVSEELNRIGVNINQIAKRANTNSLYKEDLKEILKAQENIINIYKEILKSLAKLGC